MYLAKVKLLQRSQQMILPPSEWLSFFLFLYFFSFLSKPVAIMYPRVRLSNKKAGVGNMLFVFVVESVILSLTSCRSGYILVVIRKSYKKMLKTDSFKMLRA